MKTRLLPLLAYTLIVAALLIDLADVLTSPSARNVVAVVIDVGFAAWVGREIVLDCDCAEKRS